MASLIAAWLSLPMHAHAQAVNPAAAAAQQEADNLQRLEQQRLQREQDELRRRGQSVGGTDTSVIKPKTEKPQIGAGCRDIDAITIEGTTKLPSAAREKLERDFSGRCLSADDLEKLLAEITAQYIQMGHITTRAYLPAQDLAQKKLKIQVVEGIVSKLVVRDNKQGASVNPRNIFPGIEGKILNLRDLEQGIDQLARLSSNDPKFDIEPAEKPGESVVVINNNQGSPFHFGVNVDNTGSKSTGQWQTGVNFGTDNLLGWNEALSITHRQSTPGDRNRKNSVSDSVNFAVPYGYTTISGGMSRSEYVSTSVAAAGNELLSNGDTTSYNLRADRVVYRDKDSRVSVSTTLTNKTTNTYFEHLFLAVASRTLTVWDLDLSMSTKTSVGMFSAELGYSRGLKMLGALRSPTTLTADMPTAQFDKYRLSLGYSLPFDLAGHKAMFTSNLTAQRAGDTLFGSEQMLIGGTFTVRGFVRNTLSGDNGYYWRNELSVNKPVSVAGHTINTRAHIGVDTGRVSSRAANVPEGSLTGAGAGVSMQFKNITVALSAAKPISAPSFMTKESAQTWLRVSYAF